MNKSKVNKKGRTFLERYIARELLLDPEYIERKKDKRRATYNAVLIDDEDDPAVLIERGRDYSDEIRARKESREYDRRAFAAQLAKLVDDWKPELMHAKLDVPIVKRIEDTFTDYRHAIEDAPEDDIVGAIATLSDLYHEMHDGFETLKAEVLAYSGEGAGEDDAGDAPVTIWSMDIGRYLIKELGQEYRYLKIDPAPIAITVPKALFDAFESQGDLMTPAQIQHEASRIAEGALNGANALSALIEKRDAEIRYYVNKSREKGDVRFADDDAATEWMEMQLEKFIQREVNPEIAELVDQVSQRVETLVQSHAERAAAIASHLRHRKRKIARQAVAPIIGITAGTLGILLGTGAIVLAPATGGISAVGGAGIVLASVAALRASASGIKLLHDQLRHIGSLTNSLKKDADALIKSYEKGSVAGKEIAGTVVNSLFVATIVKTFPRLKDKFDLIEKRVAKVSSRQAAIAAQLNDTLNAIEKDRDTLRDQGHSESIIDKYLEPFEAAVDELIKKIIEIGEKISMNKDGDSFTTIYARAKDMLGKIEGMIGSKTAMATAIIPVVTEFAFLIANASVGCAGLFEASSTLAVAVNGAVVIGGEIGDGIGAIDAV